MPSLMCEHPELQSFLEGKIPPGEEQAWFEHLETCSRCQARIEEMAADRNWWQDAKTFLSTDSEMAAMATPTVSAVETESEETGHDPISLDFLAPSDDPESLGRLGTYEVTGIIGRGGSGVVLKAFDRSLNRNVAIKVLSPHLATSGAARKRFAREAQAAAAVVHEHVIPIFAVAAQQNLPYIVMQYFPGRSLQQRLDRDGPLELREVLRIGLQTARGLAAAHAQGLIHRDVKPANILLADGIERVTLSDFGLARALDDARLTRTGWLAGTPEYMSPEQSRGKGMDARSDLFSLGSVLYTASTGRVPFQAETSYGTLRQVTDDDPTPIRQLNADIPDWLCGLIGKLMAKAPENRFESAEDVANLLETCLAHVQQPEATALPQSLIVKKPKAKTRGDRPTRVLAAVFIALMGFAAGAFALWQASGPPDIAGWWTGEDWGKVQLKHLGSGEYEGTYTDTFGKVPGTIHLNWSRIEGRFVGTWREGDDRLGELSIRLVKDEIRGALTTDAKSKINPATPRLADLLWVKENNDAAIGDKKHNRFPDRQINAPDHTAKSEHQNPSNSRPSGSLAGQSDQAELRGGKQSTEIFAQLQGDWVTVRKLDGKGNDQLSNKAEVWSIAGNRILFGSTDAFFYEMKIVDLKNPTTVDLFLHFNNRDDKIPEGQLSGRCLLELKDGKLFFCQGSATAKPDQLAPSPGCIFYELIRLPRYAETASDASLDRPKGQLPWFKDIPYLNRLFAQPNLQTEASRQPFAEYRLNLGPRLICHQGPMETNGYFSIHLTRRVEDRVVTCTFGGTSYRMYWKYLGRIPFPTGEPGDVYEIKRKAPANAENPEVSSRTVVYRGSRVKVFDDGNPSVIIEAANFQGSAPEIADGKLAVAAMIKKLTDIRSLECEMTIAERNQPEKTMRYYQRGDQVCLEEPEKRRILWDFATNRVLHLDLATKTAAVFDLNQPRLASLGRMRDQIDFLTFLRSLTGSPASYELTQKVQEQHCDLYHVVPEKGKEGNGPWALWLNQTTHLPAILEGCLLQNRGTYYLREFRWNPSLKESLFTFDVPTGFSVVGGGNSQPGPEGTAKKDTVSQGSPMVSPGASGPTIRIRLGNGPSAEIIERPLEVGKVLSTFKLGNPGMEWEVTCQGKGTLAVASAPSAQVFDLQWKFVGDQRLPAQKTGAETAFLIAKATKVVDEPDFGIDLISQEAGAKFGNASGPKTRFDEALGKLNGIQSAVLFAETIDEDKSGHSKITYIKGDNFREMSGSEGNRTIVIYDRKNKKSMQLNESLKTVKIDNDYHYSNRHEVDWFKAVPISWSKEYLFSEVVNNKTCDLYRIWPNRSSTHPYRFLSLVWIDQATKLPVVRASVAPTGRFVRTEIDWNPSLSDALFSMSIPKGYALEASEESGARRLRAASAEDKDLAGDLAPGPPDSGKKEKSSAEKEEAQKIIGALSGNWMPTVYSEGLYNIRTFQPEFPPPVWEFTQNGITFQTANRFAGNFTSNPISASLEIVETKNPVLIKLTYPNRVEQFLRIQMKKDELAICAATQKKPEAANPTVGCEYWELKRSVGEPLKRDWAIHLKYRTAQPPASEEWPPSKDLLFPIQPAPKTASPNLVMNMIGVGWKNWKKELKPMPREYESHVLDLGIDSQKTQKLTWLYRGRNVSHTGNDEDLYEISLSESINNVEINSWSKVIVFSGEPVKVWEAPNITVSVEASSKTPYPSKRVKEDPVLAAMIKKVAQLPSGTWTTTFSYSGNPITTKANRRFIRQTMEYVKDDNYKIFDLEKSFILAVGKIWAKEAEYKLINKMATVNEIDWRALFGSMENDPCEYVKDDVDQSQLCSVYRVYPVDLKDKHHMHTLIWVNKISGFPWKAQAKYHGGSEQTTTFNWDAPVNDWDFEMKPPAGHQVKNRELYLEKMGLPIPTNIEKVLPGSSAAEPGKTEATPAKPKKKSILPQLQGRWKPVQIYQGLTKLSDGFSRSEKWLEVSGDKLDFISDAGKARHWMTIELNNDDNPFQMDLVREHVSGRCVGVVEGSKLRLCQGTAFRQAKKAEPTEGLKYVEYERTDSLPEAAPRATSTAPSEIKVNREDGELRRGSLKVLEPYQGEWTLARSIDENLHALDVSKLLTPEKPWVVFGESFTIAGVPADHVVMVFTVPGKPIKIELVFKAPTGDSSVFLGKKEIRVPSLWSIEGNQLRVILGREGKEPEKLEPTQGFKYFELTRAERKPTPNPATQDKPSEASSATKPGDASKSNAGALEQLLPRAAQEMPVTSTQPPNKPTPSADSSKAGQSSKEEIFKRIAGDWVVIKHAKWNQKIGEVAEKAGDVWEIKGNQLKTWGRADLPVELELIGMDPLTQIDWIYPGYNRFTRGPSNPDGSRIHSLWAIENGKLKVVIVEQGKLPEKIEPCPGCIYFELVRKTPVAPSPSEGYPASFQGRWKLTKTIGPDRKEDAANRGEIVTISKDRLQIGSEVKKAELVQSGNLLKMNFVIPAPGAVDSEGRALPEIRLPSLWELKGDQLRYVCGKEIPNQVEPAIGNYYFEFVRVAEPEKTKSGNANSRP